MVKGTLQTWYTVKTSFQPLMCPPCRAALATTGTTSTDEILMPAPHDSQRITWAFCIGTICLYTLPIPASDGTMSELERQKAYPALFNMDAISSWLPTLPHLWFFKNVLFLGMLPDNNCQHALPLIVFSNPMRTTVNTAFCMENENDPPTTSRNSSPSHTAHDCTRIREEPRRDPRYFARLSPSERKTEKLHSSTIEKHGLRRGFNH